jgi:CDP-diacylglycerol--serine O-phosphatidyltransferase
MQKQIPNLFTLLNLVLGCIAIVFILQNGIVIQTIPPNAQLGEIADKLWIQPLAFEDGNQLVYLPENLIWASIFIFAAAVVDFLDGLVARLMKATSEMGKQLDSLSDVVSFGVAPSLIMYQLLRFSYMKEEGGLQISMWLLIPVFLIACAGAYRLARFNIDASRAYGFKGLPIPAAGILIASFPLMLHAGSSWIDFNEIFTNKWILYSIVILVSWLMISSLPLMALKFKDLSVKNNLPKIILLGIAVVAALSLGWLSVPVTLIAYIILSLIFKNK